MPSRLASSFRAGTTVLNALFGLELRCYTGTVVHRLAVLRTVQVKSTDFLYQAEALVRLIRRGATVTEVGVDIRPRTGGKTKIFRLKNLCGMTGTLLRLAWTVRVLGRA